MTSWNPGAGDHEVLSQGSDLPPRRPRGLHIALVVACLALGFVAGSRTVPQPAPAADRTAPAYAAGSIEKISRSQYDHEFTVPVHNPTADPVTATVVALTGWAGGIERESRVSVPAGSWMPVPFTPAADCSQPPFTVRAVVVEIESGSETSRHELGLAGPAVELRDYHLVQCAPNTAPTPAQLAGVWIVEEAAAGGSWLQGRLLIWFREDGTFAWDADGRLFERLPEGIGRYSAGDGVLRQRLLAGTACKPGDSFVWRASMLPDDRLHLELERAGGYCTAGPGEVWELRRVLFEFGLPSPPSGVRSRP